MGLTRYYRNKGLRCLIYTVGQFLRSNTEYGPLEHRARNKPSSTVVTCKPRERKRRRKRREEKEKKKKVYFLH